MIKSSSKRGRKAKLYDTTWGERIQGLARRPSDGRWRVIATGFTYTEPDERLAVLRFREIEAKLLGKPGMQITLSDTAVGDTDRLTLALQKFMRPMDALDNPESQIRAIMAIEDGSGDPTKLLTIEQDDNTYKLFRERVDEATFWPWLRGLIIRRPQYVAEMTGIEQIGYLAKVLKPDDSPTLYELGEMYFGKPGLSPNELSRSKLFWSQFCKAVEVSTVGELTHDGIIKYEAKILAGGYQPKSILHRYRKIRTILAYAIKRGKGIEDCRKALDVTALLEVKEHNPLDPQPISMEDFWKIYNKAVQANDDVFAALMLTAMNMGGYSGEVSALKWEDVDLDRGTLLTRRPKTGVSRVAVLWPEVIHAVRKLDKRYDHIFNSVIRSHNSNSVLKKWRLYREFAKLSKDLAFGQIRDAAYTIACKVSLDQARVLAGHRLPGMSDNYVRRSPQFVKESCLAIHKELFHDRSSNHQSAQSQSG